MRCMEFVEDLNYPERGDNLKYRGKESIFRGKTPRIHGNLQKNCGKTPKNRGKPLDKRKLTEMASYCKYYKYYFTKSGGILWARCRG